MCTETGVLDTINTVQKHQLTSTCLEKMQLLVHVSVVLQMVELAAPDVGVFYSAVLQKSCPLSLILILIFMVKGKMRGKFTSLQAALLVSCAAIFTVLQMISPRNRQKSMWHNTST